MGAQRLLLKTSPPGSAPGKIEQELLAVTFTVIPPFTFNSTFGLKKRKKNPSPKNDGGVKKK